MSSSPEGKTNKRGRKLVPALCNILGMMILLSVIVSFLPITLARARGHEVYNVVSGSMEPEIPVGSLIYVEPVVLETVEEGDVIAFHGMDSVIAHRVVRNRVGEGDFITKGDANEENDMNPVKYASVVGKMTHHYPIVGGLLEVYTTNIGKAYALCFAACGAMLNMLAGRLRKR